MKKEKKNDTDKVKQVSRMIIGMVLSMAYAHAKAQGFRLRVLCHDGTRSVFLKNETGKHMVDVEVTRGTIMKAWVG